MWLQTNSAKQRKNSANRRQLKDGHPHGIDRTAFHGVLEHMEKAKFLACLICVGICTEQLESLVPSL